MSPHPPLPCRMEAVAPPDHTFSQNQPPLFTVMQNESHSSTRLHFFPKPFWHYLANVLTMPQQVASLPLYNVTNRYLTRGNASPFSSHFSYNALWTHFKMLHGQKFWIWILWVCVIMTVWLLWLFGWLEWMCQGHFGLASSLLKQSRMSELAPINRGLHCQHAS